MSINRIRHVHNNNSSLFLAYMKIKITSAYKLISLFVFTSLLTFDTLDLQSEREIHGVTFVDWSISIARKEIDVGYLSQGQVAVSRLFRCDNRV